MIDRAAPPRKLFAPGGERRRALMLFSKRFRNETEIILLALFRQPSIVLLIVKNDRMNNITRDSCEVIQ